MAGRTIHVMAKPVPLPPPGFDELSPEEQLRYLQSLWERVSVNPERLPVPEWHRSVLTDRVAEHEVSPDDVVPWPEARANIERDLDESDD